MTLLISYDLRNPIKNYDDLYTTLKTADSWWHYLESTWLLNTADNVDDWQKNKKNP